MPPRKNATKTQEETPQVTPTGFPKDLDWTELTNYISAAGFSVKNAFRPPAPAASPEQIRFNQPPSAPRVIFFPSLEEENVWAKVVWSYRFSLLAYSVESLTMERVEKEITTTRKEVVYEERQQ